MVSSETDYQDIWAPQEQHPHKYSPSKTCSSMIIKISIEKLTLIVNSEGQLFRWLMINNIIKRVQNLTLNGKIQTFEICSPDIINEPAVQNETDEDEDVEEIDEAIIRDMGVLNFIFEDDNV